MAAIDIVRKRLIDVKWYLLFCMFGVLLSYCPFVFGLYQKLLVVSLGWGLLLLANEFFVEKKFYENQYWAILLLFCISYAITIILNRERNFLVNCGQLLYTAIYFFICYCCFSRKQETERHEILTWLFCLILIYVLIICTVSLVMLVMRYQGEYSTRGTVVNLGVMTRGNSIQLAGIGTSSSLLGALCVIALLSAVILNYLEHGKHRKLIIAACSVFILTLCAANAFTALLMLLGFVVSFAVFRDICHLSENNERRVKSVFIKVGKYLLLSLIVVLLYYGIQYIEATAVNTGALLDALPMQEAPQTVQIVRSPSTSLTGVRLSIWKEALKLFMKHPFGVTNANIEVRVFYGVPNYPYYNLHNGYMTLLVSSGIIGFLLMSVFGVLILCSSVKYLLSDAPIERKHWAALLMACLASVLAGDLVNECVVLWRGAQNILFWLLLGELYSTVNSEAQMTTKENLSRWIKQKFSRDS